MGLLKKKARDRLKNKKITRTQKMKKFNYTMNVSKNKNKINNNKSDNNTNRVNLEDCKKIIEEVNYKNKNKYFVGEKQKKMPIKMLQGIRKKEKQRMRESKMMNRETGILYDSTQYKEKNEMFYKKKIEKKRNLKRGSDRLNGNKFKDGELFINPDKILN